MLKYALYAEKTNCHEADLVFGHVLPHKINNFDKLPRADLVIHLGLPTTKYEKPS